MLNNFEIEPMVSVGILHAPHISLILNGLYKVGDTEITGPQSVAQTADGIIEWNGKAYKDLKFQATSDECCFELKDVVIGVNFHWERKENQRFKGDLSFIDEDGLWAVNYVKVEDYLSSVITSEMSAKATTEFLKAHAVISRSWLLSQFEKKENSLKQELTESGRVSDEEIIRWYDREDHKRFHVCADDHCQRYQGVGRQTGATVAEAISATRGLVLIDNQGELCDARFSKSCGGVFEEFENCWDSTHHHYLEARRDYRDENDFPDLREEKTAEKWIKSRPEAFCNTTDERILSQVLNDYDLETKDFFRWQVEYDADEISRLVKERSGIDFGEIRELKPLSRGTSGRIYRLRISGSKRTMTIGKELEIRRILSPSHLYSSAFTVEKGAVNVPGNAEKFILKGAGWGHGVGLCQIGAAVMASEGYTFEEILAHYYPGAQLKKIYN